MNGGAESIGKPHTRVGRHRLGGAGGWTPSVPAQPIRTGGHKHRLNEAPLHPSATGSLPVFASTADFFPLHEPASGFVPMQGELPLPRPSVAPIPAWPSRESEEDPAALRKKVTLTPRPVRRVEEDEDVRIYLAPPLDGLGTFDLGSVPASVTPPKSWRKAAWFAALSSSGVVVALLFAGSFLVGAPAGGQAAQGWPGDRGGQPLVNGEQEAGATSAQNGSIGGIPAGGTDAPKAPGDQRRLPDGTTPDGRGPGSGAIPPGTTAGITTTGQAGSSSSRPPQKPPITLAPMESQPPRFWPQMNADQMGRTSQDFLNRVPGNPAAACDLTTGELRDKGPQALAEHYSDIAFFEVKHVYIDQNEGYTINTVEVTHRDGSKTIERRTLVFGDDNKIKSDGR